MFLSFQTDSILYVADDTEGKIQNEQHEEIEHNIQEEEATASNGGPPVEEFVRVEYEIAVGSDATMCIHPVA